MIMLPATEVSDKFELVSVRPTCPASRGKKRPPLGESGGAFGLEVIPAGEASVLVEVVVDGRVNGGENLQTSHPPEPEHRAFASSKREM